MITNKLKAGMREKL